MEYENETKEDEVLPTALPGEGMDYLNEIKERIDTGNVGYIRGGQTAYDAGTGFWLGNDKGTPKLSVGSDTEYVRFDGTNLESTAHRVVRNLQAGIGITQGQALYFGTDGRVYSTDALNNYVNNHFIGFAAEDVDMYNYFKVIVSGISDVQSSLATGDVYYLDDATFTIDQNTNSGNFWSYVGFGAASWQSFTVGAGVTELSMISFGLMINSSGTTLTDYWIIGTIKLGEGTGGDTLGSGTWYCPVSAWLATQQYVVDFYFNMPIQVAEGQKYTIVLTKSTGLAADIQSRADTGHYAGGKSENVNTTFDWYVRTYHSSDRGLLKQSTGTYEKIVGVALSDTSLIIKDWLKEI